MNKKILYSTCIIIGIISLLINVNFMTNYYKLKQSFVFSSYSGLKNISQIIDNTILADSGNDEEMLQYNLLNLEKESVRTDDSFHGLMLLSKKSMSIDNSFQDMSHHIVVEYSKNRSKSERIDQLNKYKEAIDRLINDIKNGNDLNPDYMLSITHIISSVNDAMRNIN